MAEARIASSYSGDWLARVVYNEHFDIVAARLREAMTIGEERRAMDSRIWELLSGDLVEKVLSLLPFRSLFQVRVVCKRWASFILSPKFQAVRANGLSWTDLSPHASHLLLFLSFGNTLACTAYNPDLNRWLSMPTIPCLPSRAQDVVASDAGLLCFRDRNSETGATDLFVCNPVTQECSQLPAMAVFQEATAALDYVWIFTHLIVERATGTYALVVGLYDHQMRAHLEVYSSVTNAWTSDTSMALHNLGVFFNPQVGALCNNVLYCVVTERADPDAEVGFATGTGVVTEPLYVRYLVSTDLLGNWVKLRQFKSEKRPLHMTNLHVVECLGSLFMVVGEWTNYAASELEIAISVLDASAAARMVEVERLLDVRLTQGWQPPFQLRSYTCIAQGENICLLDLTSVLVLAFNVKTCVWRWLPPCPFMGVKHFHYSLADAHRRPHRPRPKGCLFSEVSFQPSLCSLHSSPNEV